MNSTGRTVDSQTLEARLAFRLAGSLSAGAERLPHDIGERLRFAREQALARARTSRLAAASAADGTQVVGVSNGGSLLLGSFASWLQRAASVMPLLVLLGGLVLVNEATLRERVVAAAEIDSLLLGDELPPTAYSDPGFAEFLRSDASP